jgi:hypothetical protein
MVMSDWLLIALLAVVVPSLAMVKHRRAIGAWLGRLRH